MFDDIRGHNTAWCSFDMTPMTITPACVSRIHFISAHWESCFVLAPLVQTVDSVNL